jgi:hypothetical protein
MTAENTLEIFFGKRAKRVSLLDAQMDARAKLFLRTMKSRPRRCHGLWIICSYPSVVKPLMQLIAKLQEFGHYTATTNCRG